MENNKKFIAYEYKSVVVKRDAASMYEDCMRNFGWEIIDESISGFRLEEGISASIAGAATSFAAAVATPSDAAPHLDIAQKYRRDREIRKNREVVRLEKECEQALAAIGSINQKNQAWSMGISLGVGILGAVFLGFAVYSFIFSHTARGILMALVGVAGMAIGFFANVKGGKNRAERLAARVQEQTDIAYRACEQAHALLV